MNPSCFDGDTLLAYYYSDFSSSSCSFENDKVRTDLLLRVSLLERNYYEEVIAFDVTTKLL